MNRNTGRRMRLVMLMILVIAVLITSTGCGGVYPPIEKKYYSNLNNYITESAIVDAITISEEYRTVSIRFTEIDEAYQMSVFMVYEENYDIVIENGIADKITVGDVVTFTSAPRIFGNGYKMPIVALSMGDDIILSFVEGYTNWMERYRFW